ncbi:Protein of unknown function [Gryllus bimaculatus]|nr:Protein of unknown function [Gryllus bimaculatus]
MARPPGKKPRLRRRGAARRSEGPQLMKQLINAVGERKESRGVTCRRPARADEIRAKTAAVVTCEFPVAVSSSMPPMRPCISLASLRARGHKYRIVRTVAQRGSSQRF